MPPLKAFACSLAILVCAPAIAGADKPLISNGDVEVVAADFEAFLLRMPEVQRSEFRGSVERVTKALELLYTNRVLANEARREGFDQDPLIARRAKQLEEGYLAQVWQNRYQAKLVAPDMGARAREIYLLHPDRFREPERLTVEYLQISLVGRTREEALARAQEARSKLQAGESFDQLVALYSDDVNRSKTLGRIEQVTARDLEKPIADAAFALPKPGDITQPVEAGPALHLVRLVAKTPSRLRSFEEVKDTLIAAEVGQFKGLETDRRVGELKNTAKTKVHEANILELLRAQSREAGSLAAIPPATGQPVPR